MDEKDRVKEGPKTRGVLGQNVMHRRDFLRVFLYLSFSFPFYAPTIRRVLFGSKRCPVQIPFFLINSNPTPDSEKDLSRCGFSKKEEVSASGQVNESFIFPREASYYINLAG
ncbi:MAG: hypothetical protein ACUVWJ_12200 [Spirochaetota bacterium]